MKKYAGFLIVVVVLLALVGQASWRHWFPAESAGKKAAFAVNVRLAPVVLGEFQEVIEALGTVAANEAVVVTSTVTAMVKEIHFTEGQRVKAGDILVTLAANEQGADVTEQRVNVANEERKLGEMQRLITTKAISRTSLEDQQSQVASARARLHSTQARLDDYIIRATFDGAVGVRKVSAGTLVTPGTQLTTLDDTNLVKVDFNVPETFLQALKPGLALMAITPAYRGRDFHGKVLIVDTRVNPVTRAVLVRAGIPNEDGALLPGMLLEVKLLVNRSESIMVPEKSLAPQRDTQYIFTVDEQQKAVSHVVTIGRREPGFVEILSGIKVGDNIVVDGTTILQDKMPVKIIAEPAP